MSVRLVTRAVARPLGALAALTTVLSATAVLTAPAALAAGSWSSPANESVSGSSLTFTASATACPTLQNCPATKLTVTGPGGFSASRTQANIRNAETLTISVPSTSANGAYTGTLSDNSDKRTAYLNAAPGTPSGFSAQGSGARDVSFTWSGSSDADAGYVLYDENGGVISSSISPCSGTCSYALYYPNDNPGSHSYQLAAKRSSAGCGSCGPYVESGRASASATLTTPPPPAPSPTPEPTAAPTTDPTTDPSGGGSTGGDTGSTGGDTGSGTGSTGGSGTGTSGSGTGSTGSGTGSTSGSGTGSSGSGTTSGASASPTSGGKVGIPSLSAPIVQKRVAFATGFSAFGPSLGIPKLPPLPDISLPAGGEGALPLGTFQPVLPYQAPAGEETETADGTLAKPVAAVKDVLDSERLAKSLAGALIFLLVGAHLRRFLSTHVED